MASTAPSPKFRVLLTDRAWPDARIEREILQKAGADLIEAPDGDEQTLVELAKDVDAIATCWASVTADVIRSSPRLRIVARLGIGLDNIDIRTATALGIPVTNVPDYCTAEVSDHALALLLACARNVAFFHQRTKQGEYNLQAGPELRRIGGRTLGLVGFGKIARALLPKARALGLNVIAASRSANDHGTGCRMATLETLLTESDFVSLHLPLTRDTEHLFNSRTIRLMKPTAYLINTSRGGLVDHGALWSALQARCIAGAALDVFDPEPPDLGGPLFQDERVIATPHAAFSSEESLHELRTRTARQIADVLEGRRPENVVNPVVYEKPE